MAHRISRILLIATSLGVLIGVSASGRTSGAAEPGPAPIKVWIGDIRYEGREAYSIVVSASNSWPRDVLVRIVEEGFFIQGEHGWMRLPVKQGERKNGEFLLPGSGSKDWKSTIEIRPDMPDLFRTYEGDLSLMYKYTYASRTKDSTGVFNKTDEVYCWVKPGTSE